VDYHRRSDETLKRRFWRKGSIAGLSGARIEQWFLNPKGFPQAPVEPRPDLRIKAAEERLPLKRQDSASEPLPEAGKRHNVRLALSAFDDRTQYPERSLSFWRTLGPAKAARGFRPPKQSCTPIHENRERGAGDPGVYG
jgi:hypothetical protein